MKEPMVLGSLDTFLEGSRSDLRLGRLSANAGMLRGLLEYGNFRQLRLFCPSVGQRTQLEGLLEGWLPKEQRTRVRLELQVELPRVLAEGAVDVFHSCGWSRYLPGLARLRDRMAHRVVPLTGTIHSISEPDMAGRIRNFLSAPFQLCDAVFCSSTAGRQAFARQLSRFGTYAGTLERIPLGIGEESFRLPERAAARARLGIHEGEFVFLWLGRLSATTKADLGPLLYAFRRLAACNSFVRLLLAGGDDPGSRRAYEDMISELGLASRVEIRPDPSDELRSDLYAGCDAFVSPVDNHQETFGLAVVEAMAASLPCVVSDWDGYKDLVEEAVTGFRISTYATTPSEAASGLQEILDPPLAQLLLSQAVAVDVKKLSERMAWLSEHPQAAREFGARGRKRARDLFHWKSVVAEMERAWDVLRERAVSCLPGRGCEWNAFPEAFEEYPTLQLSNAQRLALSCDAEAVLAGNLPMPATWSDLGPLSDGRLMTWIVMTLRQCGTADLSALKDGAMKHLGTTETETSWMVLWLLKYGLLEISEPQ
jgi:glycosyltransferase involved in cell wall biosynthesis